MDAKSISSFLEKNRKLSEDELNECINSWNKYVSSNQNLRSYINGSVVSIRQDFFDGMILDILYESEDTTINELIQNISEHFLACMDDYYIIYRIRCLANKKQLMIIKENSNAYLTVIRKKI
jgi:hypothetical protein